MASLPYITAPGAIERALSAIKSAATPERVNQDFVKTILKIPGGTGNQVTAFLRKIGFVNADGTPSDLYKSLRNASTTGTAVAEALKLGYAPLYRRNEFMHAMPEQELKGLVTEETGAGAESQVPDLVVAAIQALKKFANFNGASVDQKNNSLLPQIASNPAAEPKVRLPDPPRTRGIGMNLSYTINLNLPATSDIAVFNAIFKSLKDNLLIDIDES